MAKRGGDIAGNARKEFEANAGKKVVSKKTAKNPKYLIENIQY